MASTSERIRELLVTSDAVPVEYVRFNHILVRHGEGRMFPSKSRRPHAFLHAVGTNSTDDEPTNVPLVRMDSGDSPAGRRRPVNARKDEHYSVEFIALPILHFLPS